MTSVPGRGSDLVTILEISILVNKARPGRMLGDC